VLDVGCEIGYLAGLLARAVEPSGMVIGIDPAAATIDYARRRHAGPTCQFQVGLVEKLAWPGGSFDLVVSTLAMHHVPEECERRQSAGSTACCGLGGKLLIAEMQMPRRPLQRLLTRLSGVARMAQHVPPLEPLTAAVGFVDLHAGEALAWLRYLVATKPAPLTDRRRWPS
jgi:ubiquinone/menaquinone biosynthesis C-methylase UbiE